MAPHDSNMLETSMLSAAVFKPPQLEDEVCLYPSKKCTNKRAKKKNGELHTMCEYHRIRANENQRRLERRRKAALRLPQRHEAKPSLWNREFPEPLPMPLVGSPQTPRAYSLARSPAKRPDLLSHWQPIEIEILLACLFGEGDKDIKEESGVLEPSPFALPPQTFSLDLPELV